MSNHLFYLKTGFLLGWVALTVTQMSSLRVLAQSVARNFTCTTDGYAAQVRWQGNQPQLTFGARSNPPDLQNIPVEEQSRRGIVTYTAQQEELKTTVFVYSDGTCAVAVSNSSGETTVNELGQTTHRGDIATSSPAGSDGTILSFQTSRNAVRIFIQGGETLMNVYDRQRKTVWLNAVPVKQEQTAAGTRYTNVRGEDRVEVFLNLNGDRTLVINGTSEEGY